MIRRGKRKGEATARLRDETIRSLERLGRERALLYKTLVLTGLRRNELASLTVGKLDLDGPVPMAALDAADEKNRHGSEIILRDDLALDLHAWLAEKLALVQEEAGRAGQPIPAKLPADTPLFAVPNGLVKILDRDLKAAGIPKRDERGRTLDVHALRHTFGTLLSKCGVAPRTAQAAMRHSDIRLTMNVYTDPKLLDVAGALESLPDLPLGGGQRVATQVVNATGTDDFRASRFAPGFAPTADNSVQEPSIGVKQGNAMGASGHEPVFAATSFPIKGKDPLTIPVSGPSSRGERIRTSDLLNPIQAPRMRKRLFFRAFFDYRPYRYPRFYGNWAAMARILLPSTALLPSSWLVPATGRSASPKSLASGQRLS